MGCASSAPEEGQGGVRIVSGAPGKKTSHKIVTIGNSAAGKTSIILRYTHNTFDETARATIGAAFASKEVMTATGDVIRLHIWDTAGAEMYRSMTRSFFRDAALGLVVFDVTSNTSFEAVGGWLQSFRDECPDAIAILVGNKIDREENRMITKDVAAAFASSNEMKYYEVSAKTGENIADLFEYVATRLHEHEAGSST